jgi:hypothetical protein
MPNNLKARFGSKKGYEGINGALLEFGRTELQRAFG